LDQVYICHYDGCRKAYRQQYSLQEHINTDHLGMSYPCEYDTCTKSYSNKQQLHKHIRTDHLGLKYRCDAEGCAAVCSTTRSLVKHKELHEQQNRNEIIHRHLLSLR
jgi:uncharacterized Zn-finger protein